MEKSIEGKITDRQLMMFADGELTKEEREKEFEKEFERLSDELYKLLNKPPLPCSPHPIPTPEWEVCARNKGFKKISDEYLKKISDK